MSPSHASFYLLNSISQSSLPEPLYLVKDGCWGLSHLLFPKPVLQKLETLWVCIILNTWVSSTNFSFFWFEIKKKTSYARKETLDQHMVSRYDRVIQWSTLGWHRCLPLFNEHAERGEQDNKSWKDQCVILFFSYFPMKSFLFPQSLCF